MRIDCSSVVSEIGKRSNARGAGEGIACRRAETFDSIGLYKINTLARLVIVYGVAVPDITRIVYAPYQQAFAGQLFVPTLLHSVFKDVILLVVTGKAKSESDVIGYGIESDRSVRGKFPRLAPS